MLRLLLISNSTLHGSGYLEHCASELRDFLGGVRRVAFVPWALHDHDGYTTAARAAYAAFGCELRSVHEAPARRLIEASDALFIGGGNTFRLLAALYRHGVIEPIRARCADGMPYVGSSAGANVAGITIKTTNDMPIVQPPSFDALALVPFNINPHYLDADPSSRHMGETREQRIAQFHEENTPPVVGLREGAMLRIEGAALTLKGSTGARLFERGRAAREFAPGADLGFLLE